MSEFAHTLCIGAGHPALPGHFPGEPLVPGVILLEQVALALRGWRQQRMSRVLEAKFMAPLRPGELAQIHLSDADGTRIRFRIERNGSLLARGLVEGAT